MTDQLPKPRRRERRTDEPRARRIAMRLGDDELADVEAGAALAGLTPTGYAARTVVAVAQGDLTPIPTTDREVLAELLQARTALSRIGNNLNQVARTRNAGGDVTDEQLLAVLDRVDAAVRRMDDAALATMRRRRPR
ncbi:plasmid mobilization protein [Streptomyces albidoflavus]